MAIFMGAGALTRIFAAGGICCLIGVHLGTVNVRIALSDFKGNLLDYIKDESHANKGPEVAMRHVTNLIDKMLHKAKLNRDELHGIGIGISGVLDRRTGVTLFWPKLPLWVNVPVRQILENHIRRWLDLMTRPGPRLSPNTGWPAQIRPGILSTLLSAQELEPRFFSMENCTQERGDLRVSSATLRFPKPAHFVPAETADAWKRWFLRLRLSGRRGMAYPQGRAIP